MTENTRTDAGWYDNPEDDKTLRYYDGSQWTDHTSPKQAQDADGKRPSWKRWIVPVAVGTSAFIIGSALGVYGAGGPPEVKTVEKKVEVPVEKIVEKEVEVPVEKEVVKEKKVTVTPDSCTAALDLADAKLAQLGDAMLVASDIFMAIDTYDLTAMEKSVQELDQISRSFSLDDYTAKADECRSEK